MSQVLCHNKAAAGGGTAKHHKNGYQFFVAKAKENGNWQENQAEQYQFYGGYTKGFLLFCFYIRKFKGSPQGNEC